MFDDISIGRARSKRVHRTAAERAAIVSESYEAGATVAEVARRHGVVPSQLSGWRSAARRRETPGAVGSAMFAEVMVAPAQGAVGPKAHEGVEIVAGGVSIRLPKGTPSKRIADIAHRLAQHA